MKVRSMSAAERIGAALAHREADRVPFFLGLTMHPARLLGLSLEEYFSRADAIVAGQLEMLERVGHDAVTSFTHAPAEVEAFGGSVVFYEDGPPNGGPPPLARPGALARVDVPDPAATPSLRRVLDVTRSLASRLAGRAPVLGVALGPLSLPVLQLGFDRYIDLIYDAPALVERLWHVNAEFSARWINLQLEAGAAAVVIAEPLASPSLLPRELLRTRGLEVLAKTTRALRGPFVLASASAPMGTMLPDLLALGPAGVIPSCTEDLGAVKAVVEGRAAIVGGLSGLELVNATPKAAEAMVRRAIDGAARGGGLILAEHHAELPAAVPMDTILAVAEAVRRFGGYPLARARR